MDDFVIALDFPVIEESQHGTVIGLYSTILIRAKQ